MYHKFYITLSLMLLIGWADSTTLSRVSRSAENCPVITAKPSNECVGAVSECWSPGQYDVDCGNGAEVCCFDGCVNRCGRPKVCKTIYKTRFENATKVMCNPVAKPDLCTTVTKEECSDECKNVDTVVPSVREEDVCSTVYEPVCQSVDTEICVPPAFEVKDPVCPLIHLKPADQCLNEAPSNCWSPGVPDVDCENNGLCCFNGCSNRCVEPVKNCKTEYETKCQTFEEEQCKNEPNEVCKDVEVPVECKEVCETVSEEVCIDAVEQICKEETFQNCTTIEIPVTKKVTEVVCVDKTIPECSIIYENVCTGSKVNSYQPYECKKVPKKDCREVVVKDCQDVARTVTEMVKEQKCDHNVRPVCSSVVRPKCQNVDKKQCRTDTGCVTIERQCEIVNNTVCTKVPREECTQIPKEVCPECVKKIVTNEKCTEVPREVCKKESKPFNQTVTNQVCEKVCVPKTEVNCTPVEPETVCNTIVKEMSYPVPVLSCE